MLTIMFKEIRENIVWALLILLALGASMAYVIHRSPDETLLIGDGFHLVTAMGFSAAGFVLGLIQVLVDRRPGRWDFVSHRPISRTRIFFAKVVAGAALYLLACVIPLAAAIGWIAIPGNVAAPFDWHMTLPRLADLFSGLVWYAAGLLVAARQARWIGSRLMPAGWALVASFAAYILAMNLGEAIAICAAALVIVLPAAWGEFVFGGEYEPQPLVVRLAQGIAVCAGVVIALGVGLGMTSELLDATVGRGLGHAFSFANYEVDSDGRIALSRYSRDGEQVMTDLQGRQLSEAEVLKFSDWRRSTAILSLDRFPAAFPAFAARLQSRERYRMDLGTGWAGVGHQINWSYVVNRRTIEGFDTRSLRYIGGIGPDSFVSAPALPRAFPEPLIAVDWSKSVIMGRTIAYNIDLNDRKISRLFVGTDQDPILDAEQVYFADSSLNAQLVVTRTTIHVFSDGRELLDVPLARTYTYQSLYVTRTSAGYYILLYCNGYWPTTGASVNDWIAEADGHGNILKRMQLPPLPVGVQEQAWWASALWIIGTPPAAQIAITPHWARALAKWIGIGIVCAIAAVALLRRRDQTRWTKIVWIVIALLMGVSAVLLLLSLRSRVATVRCPSCGKERLVTRETCQHCQAAFAEPARQGVEILELV
jgi:hypothetical protein